MGPRGIGSVRGAAGKGWSGPPSRRGAQEGIRHRVNGRTRPLPVYPGGRRRSPGDAKLRPVGLDLCQVGQCSQNPMFQQFGIMAHAVSTWVIPLVIAVTFHEASHGYVARLCGDDTAWRLGRVSFNPFKHIDPFGTVLLPAMLLLMRSPFLFGYAKPVPVNFRALRHPRRRPPAAKTGFWQIPVLWTAG
jgi:hypothetical protein